jgi:hypothetical protein
METERGLIRANNRKGVRSGKVGTEKDGGGRVLLRGAYVNLHENEIRRRLENVAGNAARGAREGAPLAIERDGDGLCVRTGTQALAHRIVRELEKAFHGEASVQWSDRDGSLEATWRREA